MGIVLILLTIVIFIFFIVRIVRGIKDYITPENKKKQFKTCKYCMSEIDIDATVCPKCRKTLEFSPLRVLIGLFIGSIILIAIFYFGFVANNDAPLGVRKVVCELGIRNDYPYCYYVDTDKLNDLLDNYK